MSVPESTPLADAPTESFPALHDAVATAVRLATRPVRFVAFWLAALLPFAYLPLLATGAVGVDPTGFAGLLGLNAVAFVIGHSHNSPE